MRRSTGRGVRIHHARTIDPLPGRGDQYREGVDREGVNREGVNREGVEREGVDREGVERASATATNQANF